MYIYSIDAIIGCQGPSLRSDAAGGYAALDRLTARFLQHNRLQERHALSAESAQRRHNGGEQLMLVSLRASTELSSDERETGANSAHRVPALNSKELGA